jgi:multicomponent Na+:H+ antiporter subunit D
MAAFTLSSLSLIGIPPFSGFISKWYLAVGSLERGNPWLLAVLLASSLLTAAYLGPIVYKAYFEEPKDHSHHHEIREVPFIVVPLVLTAAASLLLGIYPNLVIELAARVRP